jgi:hypothetical protein
MRFQSRTHADGRGPCRFQHRAFARAGRKRAAFRAMLKEQNIRMDLHCDVRNIDRDVRRLSYQLERMRVETHQSLSFLKAGAR